MIDNQAPPTPPTPPLVVCYSCGATKLPHKPNCPFLKHRQEEITGLVETPQTTSQAVNHPPHYGGDTTHETYKCLFSWGLESDALLWNAAKYLSRAGKKGGEETKLEDLKKARWYLDRRIESLERENQ